MDHASRPSLPHDPERNDDRVEQLACRETRLVAAFEPCIPSRLREMILWPRWRAIAKSRISVAGDAHQTGAKKPPGEPEGSAERLPGGWLSSRRHRAARRDALQGITRRRLSKGAAKKTARGRANGLPEGPPQALA